MAADRAGPRAAPRARPARARWAIELHRLVGDVATDHWRTPRYATGRYPVPQVGSGRDRHPITVNEIPVPDGQAIIDLELKSFTEVKPDLSLELRIDPLKLTFDLLVELDLTARPSYNHDKFLAYDAFLCGWSLAHPRYRAQGTRPAVVFVCPTPHAALALARERPTKRSPAGSASWAPTPSTGTTPAATTPSSPSKPTSTTATSQHSRSPPGRPDCANASPEARELALERVALLPETLINRVWEK